MSNPLGSSSDLLRKVQDLYEIPVDMADSSLFQIAKRWACRAVAWCETRYVKWLKVPSLPPWPSGDVDAVIASNQYGQYCVPRSSAHRPAALAVLRGRVYEPETIKLLINREPEGDIVHAGTYFGDFVPALARSRVNGGVVWAFEPNPENVRCAKGTIHLNGLTNVVLTEGALDEVRGIGRLATYSLEGVPLGGGSHLVEGPNEGSGANARLIEVQLISIDEVVPASRRVVVIHLDVEGHEHKALIGAVQTITRCRPLLILETLPDRDLLASLGYVVTGSVHGNSVVAPM